MKDSFTLGKRRLRGKLVESLRILDDFTNVDKSTLSEIDDTFLTRNNGTKLKYEQVNSDCTIFFFTKVVTREWNKLQPSEVQGNTNDSFKNKLDRRLLPPNTLMTYKSRRPSD